MTQTKSVNDAENLNSNASLLDELIEAARVLPTDESYSITRHGIQSFIAHLVEPQRSIERVTAATVDEMIAELDKKLSAQVDMILHDESFQKLESAWHSLKFLVDRTDFRENIKIQMLSVSKSKLIDDFEDSPEITKSGLYKTAYTAEYGQFGGQPFGSIIANYEFSPGPQDIKLLQNVASVAAMSHAPFIASASPEFFGIDRLDQLPNLKDLSSTFEGPKFAQ